MAVLEGGDDLVEVVEEDGEVVPEAVEGAVLRHAVAHGELTRERVVASLRQVGDVVRGVDLCWLGNFNGCIDTSSILEKYRYIEEVL